MRWQWVRPRHRLARHRIEIPIEDLPPEKTVRGRVSLRAWIEIAAHPITVHPIADPQNRVEVGQRLTDIAVRTTLHQDETVAVLKGHAVWIATIEWPVAIPNTAHSTNVADRADRSADMTVVNLADRASRTAITTLPITVRNTDPLTEIVGRVDRNEDMAAPGLTDRAR